MAQSKETGTERAAYTYTPGDGRRYTWDGGPTIIVESIVTTVAGILAFHPVARINVLRRDGVTLAIPRTLTAFLATVDAYRADTHRDAA